MVLNDQYAFSFQKIHKLGFTFNYVEQRYHKSEQFLNWVIVSLTFKVFFHVGYSTFTPMEFFLLWNGVIAQNCEGSI